MKTLLILRHAKSSWKHTGVSDHARPLNKRGREAAPRMGQLLAAEGLMPAVILSSTAVRARETAELAAEAGGFEGEITYLEDFYHAWPSDYVTALCGLPDAVPSAMVVGHNPGLQLLLETLTDAAESFPTAALAHIQLPIAHWSELTDETAGTLLNFWLPRALLD